MNLQRIRDVVAVLLANSATSDCLTSDDCTIMFNMVWKVVRKFLERETKQKIMVFSGPDQVRCPRFFFRAQIRPCCSRRTARPTHPVNDSTRLSAYPEAAGRARLRHDSQVHRWARAEGRRVLERWLREGRTALVAYRYG